MAKEIDIGAYSAYAIAVEHGYEGTEAEFAAQLMDSAANGALAQDGAERAEAAAEEAEEILSSIPEDYETLSERAVENTEKIGLLSEELDDNWQHFDGKLSQINGFDTVTGGWGYGGASYYHMLNTWSDSAVCTLPSLLKITDYPAACAVSDDYLIGASLYDAKGNYVRNISSRDRHSLEVIDETIKYMGLNLYKVTGESVNGVPFTAEDCGLTIQNATPAVMVSDASNVLYNAEWASGYIERTGNFDTVKSDPECIHSDYIDISGLPSIAIKVPEEFGCRVFMLNEEKTAIGSFVTLGQTIIPGDKVKYIRLNLEIKTSIGKQIPLRYKYKLSAISYVYPSAADNAKGTEYGVTLRYADDLKNALAAQRNLTSTKTNNDSNVRFPTFVHVTDVHGDADCFRNASEIAKHIRATALVNSGDTVFYYSGDDTSFVENAVNDNDIGYMVALGNHDAFGYADVQQTYDKHIAPFAVNNGYVFPAGVTAPTYYYKDFATEKLRILAVNQYEYSGHSTDTNMHYSQDQIDFLVDALETVPQDYGVIVLMHSPEKAPVKSAGYEKFYQSYRFSFNSGGSYAPITELVDAFISGTTINKTYSNRAGTTPETYTVNADFTSKASGVEFICYIAGHLHMDAIYYVPNTTNKQLMLNSTCTCSMSNKNKDGTDGDGNPYLTELSDLPRVDGTSTKDSFNVYCIDRIHGRVKVARIGSNMPYDFSEKRDYMMIPYKE